MLIKIRVILKNFYCFDIEELSRLLKDECFLWKFSGIKSEIV